MNSERSDQFLPRQRRDVTYVSRLQSVQAAIDHQLQEMEKEFPNRRVALVTFNSEVSYLPLWHNFIVYFELLIDFSLTVKAATLIFISGRGSTISSAKEGQGCKIPLARSHWQVNFWFGRVEYLPSSPLRSSAFSDM